MEGNEKSSEQSDTGVKVEEKKDYCLEYFRNMPCWKEQLRVTTGDRPWISPESWKNCYAMKQLNYETSPGYIDLDNLLQVEEDNEIRKAERQRSKKKKVDRIKDFKVTEEGITDMDSQAKSSSEDEEDNFLDEYGNVVDDTTSDDRSSAESELNADTGKRKRKKNKKKNKKVKTSDFGSGAGFPKKNWKDHDKIADDKMLNRPEMPPPPPPPPSTSTPKTLPQRLQREEPRCSSLTLVEQKTYLNLLRKFQREEDISALSNEGLRDYQIFQNFHDLVRQEQEEFQKYAKETHLDKMEREGASLRLRPEVRRYINEYYEYRLKRASLYPKAFELYKTVQDSSLRLVPQTNEQQTTPLFQMRLDKTLVEVGTIPKIMIPGIQRLQKNLLRLPGNYEKLKSKIPTNPDFVHLDQKADRTAILHKVMISKDPNAEKLTELHRPDVVISVSALKVIFDNFGPLYDQEWDIPFTVKAYEEEKVSTRVIFIDKPLPCKNISTCDKNQWYHKVASKVFLLHPWTKSHPPSESGNRPKQSSSIFSQSASGVESDNPFDDSLDSSNLETFGTDTSPVKQAHSTIQQVDGNDSDDSDDGKLVIAEGNVNENQKPAKVLPSPACSTAKAVRTLSATQLQEPSPKRRSTRLRFLSKTGAHKPWNIIVQSPVRGRGRPRGRPPGRGKSRGSGRQTQKLCDASAIEPKAELTPVIEEAVAAATSSCHGQHDDDDHKDEDLISPSKRRPGTRRRLIESDSEEEEPQEIAIKASKETITENKDEEATKGQEGEKAIPEVDSSFVEQIDKEKVEAKQDLQTDHHKDPHMEKEMKQQRVLDGSNILDGIMAAQSSLLHKETKRQRQKRFGEHLQYQGEKLHFFDSSLDEKDFISPPDNANVSYRLWNLWNKDCADRSNLRVLVRSSTHGMFKRHGSNRSSQTYTIGCKLENQTNFGAELISRSALAREWIATMIRPDSMLCRLRIDASTQQVVMSETKSLKDLAKDGLKVNFKPAEQLGNLHTLLTCMREIKEPGQYLLRHDPKSGAFVRVYKALAQECKTVGGDTFDLHLDYNAVRPNEERKTTVPWNPIDVGLITPWHYATNKVPGLFNARRGRGRGRGGRGGDGRGRGGRGGERDRHSL